MVDKVIGKKRNSDDEMDEIVGDLVLRKNEIDKRIRVLKK